jgi:predicted Fe-Mo cluster-binding NifX family protein
MRIAISSDGNSLESKVDERFGRCKYFLIVDVEDKNIKNSKAVLNEAAQEAHGAGVRAAELLAQMNVDVLLSNKVGPNAESILNRVGVKLFNASGKVEDAVKFFLDAESAHSEKETEKTHEEDERILFPLMDNNGLDSKISLHFGHAPFLGIYNARDENLKIIENHLDHADPNKSPMVQIMEKHNPNTIFAREIGRRAISEISNMKIKLKTGNFDTLREAINNLDKLEDLTQSCDH